MAPHDHPRGPVLRALAPEPHRGDQVAAGVVVLATLVLLLEVRFADAWGTGARLLVAALATAFVGTMAVLSRVDEPAPGPAQTWPRAYQTVLYVTTCLLLLMTLVELSQALGARGASSAGARTWIALAAGLVALAFSLRRNASYCTLVAAVLFAVGLLSGVDWVFAPTGDAPHRWVLLVVLAANVMGAVMLRDRRRRHAVMLVDTAGLAALALASTGTGLLLLGPRTDGLPWGWLFVVFAAGGALVAYAGADREPGPGYIGVLCLVAFAVLAGIGDGADSLLGWPLVLFVIAVAFLAIGLRPSRPLPPEPGADEVEQLPEAMPLAPRSPARPPDDGAEGAPPTDEF